MHRHRTNQDAQTRDKVCVMLTFHRLIRKDLGFVPHMLMQGLQRGRRSSPGSHSFRGYLGTIMGASVQTGPWPVFAGLRKMEL